MVAMGRATKNCQLNLGVYKAAKAAPKTIVCDQCQYEFPMESVTIQEHDVAIGSATFQLFHFDCPRCHHIYRVVLKDPRYYELEKDLEGVKKRIKRNRGNTGLASMLVGMAKTKSQRLQSHVFETHRRYPGTFSYSHSPGNGVGQTTIIYRE